MCVLFALSKSSRIGAIIAIVARPAVRFGLLTLANNNNNNNGAEASAQSARSFTVPHKAAPQSAADKSLANNGTGENLKTESDGRPPAPC